MNKLSRGKYKQMKDFEQIVKKLKEILKISKDKELAVELELTEANLNRYKTRNSIPYEQLIYLCSKHKIDFMNLILDTQLEVKNEIINNSNHISFAGHNNGIININSSDEMNMEICKCIKKLSEKRKEFYYHKIKAEILEMEDN